MSFLDTLKGSRTVIVNVVVAAFAAYSYFFPDLPTVGSDEVNAVADQGAVAWTAVLAVYNIVQRFFTTTPVFSKE